MEAAAPAVAPGQVGAAGEAGVAVRAGGVEVGMEMMVQVQVMVAAAQAETTTALSSQAKWVRFRNRLH